jgi:hypothetical protein
MLSKIVTKIYTRIKEGYVRIYNNIFDLRLMVHTVFMRMDGKPYQLKEFINMEMFLLL